LYRTSFTDGVPEAEPPDKIAVVFDWNTHLETIELPEYVVFVLNQSALQLALVNPLKTQLFMFANQLLLNTKPFTFEFPWNVIPSIFKYDAPDVGATVNASPLAALQLRIDPRPSVPLPLESP